MVGPFTFDLGCQLLAHTQARLVHINAVDHRVRTRHVNKLENAWGMLWFFGAHTSVHLAVDINKHGLTGRDIPHQLVAHHIQGHGFRGNHVLRPLIGVAMTINQRADTEGIAEGENPEPNDEDHNCIGALYPPMHRRDGTENIIRCELQTAYGMQLMRQDVKKNLGVRAGVDVTQILTEEFVF